MIARAVLVCLFFLALQCPAQVNVAKAKWKNKVEIDGLANEWSVPLGFYNAETKLFFALANDSSHLYLCFQSNDEANQVKINSAGMKVTLTYKGKPRREASIDFPLTDEKNRFAEDDLIAGKSPDMNTLKATFILQNINMGVEGFVTQKGVIPLKDTSGLNAAMNWDEKNVWTYEIVIPFKEFFGAGFQLKEEQMIAVEVEVNAVTHTEESSVDGHSAAMGASSMGQTAGMTGGMPGGGERKERKPIFDKNRFKEKFFLRTKPG